MAKHELLKWIRDGDAVDTVLQMLELSQCQACSKCKASTICAVCGTCFCGQCSKNNSSKKCGVGLIDSCISCSDTVCWTCRDRCKQCSKVICILQDTICTANDLALSTCTFCREDFCRDCISDCISCVVPYCELRKRSVRRCQSCSKHIEEWYYSKGEIPCFTMR